MSDRYRVLLVDDDWDVCDTTRTLLGQAGYYVECASSGFEALGMLAAFRPHVVLADVRMPGMDGLELIAHLHERLPDLPVILVTGTETRDLKTGANAYGAVECLTKPLNLEDAVWAIERAVLCPGEWAMEGAGRSFQM